MNIVFSLNTIKIKEIDSFGKSIGKGVSFPVSYGPGKHNLHKYIISSQTKKILKKVLFKFLFGGNLFTYLFYLNFLISSNLSVVIWSRLCD